MTVEERARKTVALMIDNRHELLVDLIAEILREQIEECAKELDAAQKDCEGFKAARYYQTCATIVRALADPREEKEKQEVER